MLIFDTVNVAMSTYFIAYDIRALGGSFHPEVTQVLTLVDAIVSKVNFFLSDLVIVWRAWSILQHRTVSHRIILIFCVCLSFGAVLADIIFIYASSFNLEKAFTLDYETSRIFLPLALLLTNIIATIFISFRAWKFHQGLVGTAAEDSRRIHHLTQVLLLMIESGCLYSLLWVHVSTF
ncbi:hypothetical protein BT96DRAFT_403583 [Gymnopus androsaceus JB14]|uniref:Uncharacterized protein n=1 Tax=Gymnopus androsaceus JB14 TaxID=1447944 RepID=A0A6A4I440_9AGAR|nr:hypothetical protein BT96DRAFT_403583 [Gymnopus androsaceus JB14]